MKNTFGFCLILLLISFQSIAQKSNKQQIKDLHDGILFVNLIVPSYKIEALEGNGQKAEAQKVAAEANAINQKIIDAFAKNYSFSKVYYVYSYDTEKLAAGDGSVAFDKDNNKLTAVPSTFFVADFSGSPERDMEGLVLKDHNFTALQKPIPYFVSAWDFFHLKKLPESEIVARFNSKLNGYYAKVLQN